MLLRTLGGLALSGASIHRPKPLLLLAYLSLEGPKERRYLAEVFWPRAARARKSLSMALTQLRAGAPGAIASDEVRVSTTLPCDAGRLLEAAARGNWHEVLSLDGGPFLEGVDVYDGHLELEEWVFGTREYLGARVIDALLAVAEAQIDEGNDVEAIHLGERALALHEGGTPLDGSVLDRLLRVLLTCGSPAARRVRAEAQRLGIDAPPNSLSIGPRSRPARPAPPATARSRGNLSAIMAPFVGREAQLVELEDLLGRARLVTITGLGGIGKSRLSMALARRQLDRGVVDAAFFVSLGGVPEASEVPARVAAVLDVPLHRRGTALDDIARHLAVDRVLLVLDEFEHLDVGAGVVLDLAGLSPRLKVVVTSRAPLGLPEEHLYPIDGLELPAPAVGLEHALASDALQLFVARARRIDPRFVVSAENIDPILGICRLVDGSPLGIELAASLVKAVPPNELLVELSETLDVLVNRSTAQVDRHASLSVVFEQSWRLLPPRQQEVLRYLSVFRKGFTRGAAARIAEATIPVLAALADRSIVRRSGARFELHPLVRTFARERLTEAPEAANEVRMRHAEYFAAFLAERSGATGRTGVHGFLRDVAPELDNVRAAWSWAASVGRNDLVAGMLPALERYHATRGLHREHLAMIEEALQRVEPGPLWSRLEQGRMRSLLAMRRYAEVRRRGVEDLAVHERVGGPADVVGVLNAISHLGDIEEARRRWSEALALADASGDERSAGASHADLALTSLDVDEVERHGKAAIASARRSGNLRELVESLRNRAVHLMHDHGRYDEAAQVAAEAVEVARSELGEDGVVASALATLCHAERARGSLDAATAAVGELEALLAGDVPPELVEELRREGAHHRACLLLARGDPAAGLVLARASLRGSQSSADHALLARLAWAAGDLDEAAASNAVARWRAAATASVRNGLRETIAADLLDADLDLARGAPARSGRHLLPALRHAREHVFVPSLFDAFVTAGALLGGEIAAVLLGVASSHPRANWGTQRRARALHGDGSSPTRELGADGVIELAADVCGWVERAMSAARDPAAPQRR
jgi:predicted ATPase/DNA-binding SARP family transcriptional activator